MSVPQHHGLCELVALTNINTIEPYKTKGWVCDSNNWPIVQPCIGNMSNWAGIVKCSDTGDPTNIDLTGAGITGSVPESFITELDAVARISLAYNSFSGSIPRALGALPVLNFLDVGYNNFGGTLPVPNDTEWQQIEVLLIDGNPLLSGPVTPHWCNKTHLNTLYIELETAGSIDCYAHCLSSTVANLQVGALPACSNFTAIPIVPGARSFDYNSTLFVTLVILILSLSALLCTVCLCLHLFPPCTYGEVKLYPSSAAQLTPPPGQDGKKLTALPRDRHSATPRSRPTSSESVSTSKSITGHSRDHSGGDSFCTPRKGDSSADLEAGWPLGVEVVVGVLPKKEPLQLLLRQRGPAVVPESGGGVIAGSGERVPEQAKKPDVGPGRLFVDTASPVKPASGELLPTSTKEQLGAPNSTDHSLSCGSFSTGSGSGVRIQYSKLVSSDSRDTKDKGPAILHNSSKKPTASRAPGGYVRFSTYQDGNPSPGSRGKKVSAPGSALSKGMCDSGTTPNLPQRHIFLSGDIYTSGSDSDDDSSA